VEGERRRQLDNSVTGGERRAAAVVP